MVRITVDLPDDVAAALARHATAVDATQDDVVRHALQDLLAAPDSFAAFTADSAAFAAWAAAGEADVAAGRVVPAEQVFADLDTLITCDAHGCPVSRAHSA